MVFRRTHIFTQIHCRVIVPYFAQLFLTCFDSILCCNKFRTCSIDIMHYTTFRIFPFIIRAQLHVWNDIRALTLINLNTRTMRAHTTVNRITFSHEIHGRNHPSISSQHHSICGALRHVTVDCGTLQNTVNRAPSIIRIRTHLKCCVLPPELSSSLMMAAGCAAGDLIQRRTHERISNSATNGCVIRSARCYVLRVQ